MSIVLAFVQKHNKYSLENHEFLIIDIVISLLIFPNSWNDQSVRHNRRKEIATSICQQINDFQYRIVSIDHYSSHQAIVTN